MTLSGWGALPTSVPVVGIVSCATSDGTFGWSNAAALHLMKKDGALLRFELCRVSGRVRMLSLNTCGGRNKWFGDCTSEGMGTHGSKHAGLGTNSETHGVPVGIFGKPDNRNFFSFPSLRTALGNWQWACTHTHPPTPTNRGSTLIVCSCYGTSEIVRASSSSTPPPPRVLPRPSVSTQERKIGAHGADTQSSWPSGYTTPLLSCRGWFEPRGG